MPDQKLKEEIDRLMISDEILYEGDLIGCCIKYYLKLPNDNHKYYYKCDTLISKILNTTVPSQLYSMSNKSLNKNENMTDDNMWYLIKH
jgi:hypothetical protein